MPRQRGHSLPVVIQQGLRGDLDAQCEVAFQFNDPGDRVQLGVASPGELAGGQVGRESRDAALDDAPHHEPQVEQQVSQFVLAAGKVMSIERRRKVYAWEFCVYGFVEHRWNIFSRRDEAEPMLATV